MRRNLIIVGIGETADIAYEYFTFDSDYNVIAYSVNREYITDSVYNSLPLIPLENLEQEYSPDTHDVFIAVSSNHLNRDRTKLFNEIKSKGYNCATYISSRAFVWKTAVIGENCMIFENNVIQHKVHIGNNVIIWSGNHIGHQTIIEDNCFLSSHIVISGFCRIGKYSFIGVNSTIANNINIGKDCFIGAASIIYNNIPDDSVTKMESAKIAKISSRRFNKVKNELD